MRLRDCLLGAILVHGLVIGWLCIGKNSTMIRSDVRRLVVHTISTRSVEVARAIHTVQSDTSPKALDSAARAIQQPEKPQKPAPEKKLSVKKEAEKQALLTCAGRNSVGRKTLDGNDRDKGIAAAISEERSLVRQNLAASRKLTEKASKDEKQTNARKQPISHPERTPREKMLQKVKERASELKTVRQAARVKNGSSTIPLDHLHQIAERNIDQEQEGDSVYEAELIERLKTILHLPEKEDVKLRLTLEKNGKVVSVEVVGSKSEKNAQYLNKQLSSAYLIPFGEHYPGISKKRFTIRLESL